MVTVELRNGETGERRTKNAKFAYIAYNVICDENDHEIAHYTQSGEWVAPDGHKFVDMFIRSL